VSASGDAAEIQGDHVVNVTKFLLSREGQLVQVSGCGKNAKAREEKQRQEEAEAEAREAASLRAARAVAFPDREEEGKKPRWSTAKKEAVARANARPDEPEGWSDDPRRCPFGWLYCSGVCMGLTPAEFKATKQLVWHEECAFYADASTRAFRPVGEEALAGGLACDLSSNMPLEAALRALGMLASGVGWAREQEKKKKIKESAKLAVGSARRVEPSFEAFVAPSNDSSSEVDRASKLQAAADAFALSQIRGAKSKSAVAGHAGLVAARSQGLSAGVGGGYKRAAGRGRGAGRGSSRVGGGGGGGGGGGARTRAGTGAWWDDAAQDDGWSSEGEDDDESCADHTSAYPAHADVRQGSARTVEMRHLLLSAEARGVGGTGNGAADGRREEEEEEAIMEAIARSLREEEEKATRRGGGCSGGGGGERVLWGGDEGLGGARSMAEVAAIVEARGWMRKLAPTACEVLASMADFDWAALVWGEDVGMSEADAFLYALEISLDSVRKRDALGFSLEHNASSSSSLERNASSSSMGATASSSAAGARAPEAFGAAAHGRGKAAEGGGEWETVMPAAQRKRSDAARHTFSKVPYIVTLFTIVNILGSLSFQNL
jgi:hypothetical protein